MAWEARYTQMWQLHMQGLSQSAIARTMAMPRTTVRDALRRHCQLIAG
jgi:DNA-binding transcriptional regulator LsrR (DeoR family)